jgi:hypothetical protein
MADFKSGAAVKIHRPAKKGHGWIGRFIELGPDPHFAWVAFDTKAKCVVLPPGDSDKLRRQDNYPRTLLPLSNIQPHEPGS